MATLSAAGEAAATVCELSVPVLDVPYLSVNTTANIDLVMFL